MLTLEHIYYSQAGNDLLSDISFRLHKGHIVGLLGVNGAGKSTTLKIVAGLLHPDRGTVTRQAGLSIGYVPEVPPLIPTWTARRFLHHACVLHGLPKKHHAEAVARVVELCDLALIELKACATLSKGNQQRLAIAQALLHQPDLLILDEPTSGLDPRQIRQFRELLQRLKADCGIIFSSHIMQEIAALCDSAIVLHEGKHIGDIDLSARDQRLLIEFAQPVSPADFADLPAWRAGEACQHEFFVDEPAEKNAVLVYCLDKQLPISRLVGIEDLAERQFLNLIHREADHAA
ncbi:MAG: gliding motility-associated ABC transporter ATP-binding subunit GldA [Gammaproteobacteria bacterium]|nr:MAG: gliding motility-associated ABC transporter ATP-binding subunit GldA [Gammaproteobacteria bacterium]